MEGWLKEHPDYFEETRWNAHLNSFQTTLVRFVLGRRQARYYGLGNTLGDAHKDAISSFERGNG